MTTIAASRTAMAGDRRVTDGDTTFSGRKIHRVGEAIVGAAGSGGAIAKFLKYLRAGDLDDVPKFGKDDELSALVLTPAGLFAYDTECQPEEILDPFYAVGSGKQAALAAMHMGATPQKAVAIACIVDNSSGEPIDVLELA